MELPNFNPPDFFDIDEEIKKLTEFVTDHPARLKATEQEYSNKHAEIFRKIEELRQKSYALSDQKNKIISKAKVAYDEKFNQLAALKKQKKAEEQNKSYEETVLLIKEICQDFASWNSARDYQVEDIVRIVHQYLLNEPGVMNANEMALGKTFESLVALYIITNLHQRKYKKKATILWLTKASILQTGGTFNEAKRWFPDLKIFPIRGSENKAAKEMVFDVAESGGICVLTNYETMKNTPRAQKIHWDFVIMDEVHKLKGGANASGPTAIWEAIKDLKIGFMMMLTGTPLVNKMDEIWSYLHLFDPHAFPDARQFSRQFSAFRDVAGKLQFDLRSETLLKDILKGRLIRRTATEVGLQLPPVVEQIVLLQHNEQQKPLYEKMRDDFFIWLDKQEKTLSATSILAQLTRLRQINVLPVANFKLRDVDGNVVEEFSLDVRDSSKLDEAVEIITQTNDQAIVFSCFNEPMEELALRLQVEGLHPEIISSKYSKEMSSYETGFQQKEIDVLLINITMGEGLNLHKDKAKWPGGARAVIFLDKWWNNAKNDQCLKRAVRPGENAGEPVFVYDLKVENSIDYFIQSLCDEKSAQFDALTESKELRPSRDWSTYLKGLL